MSLNIYRNIKDIPDGVQLVNFNDRFFDAKTTLQNDDFTRTVLQEIDKAVYLSEFCFLGRTPNLGGLNKGSLSTGTKTLLHIHKYPNLCFNVCECGNNALNLLALLSDGNVYWEIPAAIITSSQYNQCDILFEGVTYTNFSKFLQKVRYGNEV